MQRYIACCLAWFVTASRLFAASPEEQRLADDILAATGVRGGLSVHLQIQESVLVAGANKAPLARDLGGP
jgi:hypothetical protein